MKLREAIAMFDRSRPNQLDTEQKVRWISQIDHMVQDQILRHYGGTQPFSGYTAQSEDPELLIPAPYDDCYQRYLEAMSAQENAEWQEYNMAISAFQARFQDYADFYIRTHLPIQQPFHYL